MRKFLSLSRPLALPFLLGAISNSYAQQCEISLTTNDQMAFSESRIAVSQSCKQFTVTLKHVGRMPAVAMGHNWVLSKASDVQGIASEGITAGAISSFIKPGDSRVLAHTKLIGGGETTSTTFDVSPLTIGEPYAFFCSYPGHWAAMKGQLVVED